jgi:hypothetical protein
VAAQRLPQPNKRMLSRQPKRTICS